MDEVNSWTCSPGYQPVSWPIVRYRLWLSLGLVLAGLGGGLWWALHAPSQAPDAGPAWFADVTEQVGLNSVHDPGPLGTYFMPQIFGSGAALFDFDGDGR